MIRTVMFLSAGAAFLAAPVIAQQPSAGMGKSSAVPASGDPQTVRAAMIDAAGKPIGTVMLQDTPGGVLITTDLKGLPAGEHGFHFHEKGACAAAQKFSTAGGHFAAGQMQHGLMTPGGHHGGDMPNAYVGPDGVLKTSLLNTGVTLKAGPTSLFDADGSALVIHAKADDYKTQPSGAAGDRIACAVVAAPKT